MAASSRSKPRRIKRAAGSRCGATSPTRGTRSAALEDAIALSADAFAFFDEHDRLVMCNMAIRPAHGAQRAASCAAGPSTTSCAAPPEQGRIAVDDDESWIARRSTLHQRARRRADRFDQRGQRLSGARPRHARRRPCRGVHRRRPTTAAPNRALEEQTQHARPRRAGARPIKDEAEQRERYLADLTPSSARRRPTPTPPRRPCCAR